ncbi:DNA binding protein [Streptomyces phage Satis]|nr:DNA binding protein [Streptomyces phage Satis]QBZ71911.1 DNA binding protein [Streptomyces phage Kradal]QPL14329.1 DNA binding protein [Streptomyces phage EhyElimayoE]
MAQHDSLAQVMVDYAAQGMTLAQIAARVGMDIESVHERMTAYLENQATSMSVTQMRMLQLSRLERIIGALWEQVMAGDLLTQGRNVKNMIETIREITELMDLKKDRLRDEQVRLTQAQTQLVTASIEAIRVGMLERIVEILPEESREAVEHMWNSSFPAMAADAIARNTAATVKMGAGAGPIELEPVMEEFD